MADNALVLPNDCQSNAVDPISLTKHVALRLAFERACPNSYVRSVKFPITGIWCSQIISESHRFGIAKLRQPRAYYHRAITTSFDTSWDRTFLGPYRSSRLGSPS